MKYNQFEELPVWQAAVELKLEIDQLLERPEIERMKNWVDQIDRASLSISNNIAEGFERGTTNELLQFLYIARGSAGETRSMLQYARRKPKLQSLKAELTRLVSRTMNVGRQLGGWASSLQNSDIKGQRHLTDQSRESYQRNKRNEKFWKEIRDAHQANVEQWIEQRRSESAESDPSESE